jgi:hypothetical protein
MRMYAQEIGKIEAEPNGAPDIGPKFGSSI